MSIQFFSSLSNTAKLTAKKLNDINVLRDTLPLFNHVRHFKIDEQLLTYSKKLKSFKDIIVLGTGGSSLGGKSLCEFAASSAPTMHFCDNIDPKTFKKLFAKITPKTTGVIVISKSGSTAETLMQFMVCLDHWEKNNLEVANHFIAITEPTNNMLGQLAKKYHILCLDHATDIGGRFAVFTNVGILPALVSGVNVDKFIKGAKSCLHKLDDNIPSNPAVEGALIQYELLNNNKTVSVLMPYIDQLNTFALWYRQLWAESLGKDGKGTTPIAALGTVDQHSQLQLFLDGPKDKFFTVITTSYDTSDDFKVNHDIAGLELYQNHTMGELMEAEQQATIDTLKNNNCPVRHIHLDIVDEYALGYMMMHYVIETLAMASILGVNAFDQPAVEEGKVLTRQYLAA
ncbi:MAG: hypothetical protein KF820_00175 [Candidatus Paracaedibacteraceae bacterium]|jgi:glucose-6-phosphate isomerase|nr:hypothetical protein [Candidatus Paracaedibacteraceae bacterium]